MFGPGRSGSTLGTLSSAARAAPPSFRASLAARETARETPLHRACAQQSRDAAAITVLAQQAVAHGGQKVLLAEDLLGFHPLHTVAAAARPCNLHGESRAARVAAALIALGADPSAVTPRPWESTAAHLGAAKDDGALIAVLAEYGAWLDAPAAAGMTVLHVAAQSASLHACRALLDLGAAAAARCDAGSTPLHAACEVGAEAVVLALVDHGVDVDDADDVGVTPLHEAAAGGHAAVAKELLRAGANVDKKDAAWMTPLFYAAVAGHADVVRVLVDYGANVAARDAEGYTALHHAADARGRAWRKEVVLELLRAGAAPEMRADVGMTAHAVAVRADAKEVALPLRMADAPVLEAIAAADMDELIYSARKRLPMRPEDLGGVGSWSVLHEAARLHDATIIEFLLDLEDESEDSHDDADAADGARAPRKLLDANYTARLEFSRTPLHIAAACGRPQAARALVRAGADVNALDAQGRSPLHLAAIHARRETMSTLFELGASSATQPDVFRHTAKAYAQERGVWTEEMEQASQATPSKTVHAAVASNDVRLVRVMLEGGVASVEDVDHNLHTPIQIASLYASGEMVGLLLQHGSDIESRMAVDSRTGLLPLHMACQALNESAVRALLVEGNADPVLQSGRGTQPIHEIDYHAGSKGTVDAIVTMLARSGANVNAQAKNGERPLHVAVRSGNADAVQVLLDHGADAKAKDAEGETPFKVAVRLGLYETAHLLTPEEDVNSMLPSGLTLLQLACQSVNLQAADGLLQGGADVHARTLRGQTAAHCINFRSKDFDSLSRLIVLLEKYEADFCAEDDHGNTPLHLAAEAKSKLCCTCLVLAGSSKTARNFDGMRALDVALAVERPDIAEVCALERKDAVVRTIETNDKLGVKRLLANGEDPDGKYQVGGQDPNGEDVKNVEPAGEWRPETTPLHAALRIGSLEMTQMLIEAGADPTIINRTGYSAVDIGAVNRNFEAVQYLLEHGGAYAMVDESIWRSKPKAEPAEETEDEAARKRREKRKKKRGPLPPFDPTYVPLIRPVPSDPLHKIVLDRSFGKLKELVERPSDKILVDGLGHSPLHLTAAWGWLEATRWLIDEAGANIEAFDRHKWRPLHMAVASEESSASVNVLLAAGADVAAPNVHGFQPLHVVSVGFASTSERNRTLEALIAAGAKVDAVDRENRTPLYQATQLGSVNVVSRLLQHNASKMIKGRDGRRPVHVAIDVGNRQLEIMLNVHEGDLLLEAVEANDIGEVTACLERGAPARGMADAARLPLQAAVRNDNLAMVQLLVWNGADVNATDGSGETPLHVACSCASQQVVLFLLANEAWASQPDGEDVTPLHMAVRAKHDEVVEEMMKRGSDPFAVDRFGDTALHVAAATNNFRAVCILLDYATVGLADTVNLEELSPFEIAAGHGHAQCARLLDNLSDFDAAVLYGDLDTVRSAIVDDEELVNDTDMRGRTPLHRAVLAGFVDMANMLIDCGADPNAQDVSGDSPLHLAARLMNELMVRLLLARGAFVNLDNNLGRTPLHVLNYAIATGGIIGLLVKHGANVNVEDEEGQTSLHAAAAVGSVVGARFLVAAGASKTVRDAAGRFPMDIASMLGLRELMFLLAVCTPLHSAVRTGNMSLTRRLLQAAGDSINERDDYSDTPVITAVKEGHDDILDLLLARGGAVAPADSNGETALHHAARADNVHAVRALLEHGALPHAPSKKGETALDVARTNGHTDAVLLLTGSDAGKSAPATPARAFAATWSGESSATMGTSAGANADFDFERDWHVLPSIFKPVEKTSMTLWQPHQENGASSPRLPSIFTAAQSARAARPPAWLDTLREYPATARRRSAAAAIEAKGKAKGKTAAKPKGKGKAKGARTQRSGGPLRPTPPPGGKPSKR